MRPYDYDPENTYVVRVLDSPTLSVHCCDPIHGYEPEVIGDDYATQAAAEQAARTHRAADSRAHDARLGRRCHACGQVTPT